ncbi:hypothetical protein [Holospora undulata]|uniref:Uncharacterized protein n=1 Tax=Holospora undulata HU1 TaxID=1321371 RepID=A0A061JIY6_9PROT|nr:hypothetical protein [Holospora undulata]ETZ05379.1 hypothetical protein K737_300188 [Holospora undulata HU1]
MFNKKIFVLIAFIVCFGTSSVNASPANLNDNDREFLKSTAHKSSMKKKKQTVPNLNDNDRAFLNDIQKENMRTMRKH